MNYLLEVLKQFPNWVQWRLEDEQGKPWTNDSKGKCKKPPYQILTRGKAWINRPAHWCRYGAWGKWFVEEKLGFVLTEACNFICIDLDNKQDDPARYDLHRRIMEDFKDTHAEYSPSGKGKHIWVFGTFEKGIKHKFDEIGVEFYCRVRYMTVTLNPLPDHNIPLTDGTERVAKWIAECNRLTGKQEKPKPPTRTANMPTVFVCGDFVDRPSIYRLQCEPLTLSDVKILRRFIARPNYDKCANLYNGNWVDLGYPSQSEADQAYCNIIAYYTDDPVQVARIFMHSKLGENISRHYKNYLWDTIDTAFDLKRKSTNGIPKGGA